MKLVRDAMTRKVKLTHPDRPIKEAAAAMKEFGIGALPVVDHDKVVGMLTDRDIAVRVVAAGRNAESTQVREAMTSSVSFCYDNQGVDDVIKLMTDKAIRRVVVLDKDKHLVGMCTLGDLARDDEEAREVGHILHELVGKPSSK